MVPTFARFTDDCYWFSLSILLRRFLIGITKSLSIFHADMTIPSAQALWVAMVMIFAMLLNDWYRPYRFSVLHTVDQLTMGGTVVLTFTAIASPTMQPHNFADVLIFLVLMGIYIFTFVLIVVYARRYWFARQRRVMNWKTLAKVRIEGLPRKWVWKERRGGNRLAYPHRTGFRPVSDQCHAGCTVHVTVSCRVHSPCGHRVMSDAQSCRIHRSVIHVGCTVSLRMQSLDRNP